MSILYAEDIDEGAVLDLGSYTVATDELVNFARQWDPQGFHIDPDAAATGPFGSVIASGIHTLAIFQRLSVLAAERNWAVIAGVEMRRVRFRAPVLPGAVLSGRLRVDRVQLDPERNRGLVAKTGWLYDSDGCVIELNSDAYVRMR